MKRCAEFTCNGQMAKPVSSPKAAQIGLGVVSLILIFLFAGTLFHVDLIDRMVIPEDAAANTLSSSKVALVTYFAPQKNPSFKIWGDNDQYTNIIKHTFPSMAAYTTFHSMPFFFRHAYMVNTEDTSAYWGKMAVVEKYLDAGFRWVIWTDIDGNHTLQSCILEKRFNC